MPKPSAESSSPAKSQFWENMIVLNQILMREAQGERIGRIWYEVRET